MVSSVGWKGHGYLWRLLCDGELMATYGEFQWDGQVIATYGELCRMVS